MIQWVDFWSIRKTFFMCDVTFPGHARFSSLQFARRLRDKYRLESGIQRIYSTIHRTGCSLNKKDRETPASATHAMSFSFAPEGWRLLERGWGAVRAVQHAPSLFEKNLASCHHEVCCFFRFVGRFGRCLHLETIQQCSFEHCRQQWYG